MTRQAVRALLINPSLETLLIYSREPRSGAVLWLTPGGGLEPDETPEAALRREVYEETGLRDFTPGPLVWRRQHTFVWDGMPIDQHERYYLIHVPHFEPTIRHMPEDDEWGAFEAFRWWSVASIRASSAVFAPRLLGELLHRLFSEGAPESPHDAGI
jgi:8-oxo-dGTP pyrophosphatase MutT (NUDIX family)